MQLCLPRGQTESSTTIHLRCLGSSRTTKNKVTGSQERNLEQEHNRTMQMARGSGTQMFSLKSNGIAPYSQMTAPSDSHAQTRHQAKPNTPSAQPNISRKRGMGSVPSPLINDTLQGQAKVNTNAKTKSLRKRSVKTQVLKRPSRKPQLLSRRSRKHPPGQQAP